MFEVYAKTVGLPYLWKTVATPLAQLQVSLTNNEKDERTTNEPTRRLRNSLKLTPSLNLKDLNPEEQNLSKWHMMMTLQELFLSVSKSIKNFPK